MIHPRILDYTLRSYQNSARNAKMIYKSVNEHYSRHRSAI